MSPTKGAPYSTKAVKSERKYGIGRSLVIAGPRPEWFKEPSGRDTFFIEDELVLELQEQISFRTVTIYSYGSNTEELSSEKTEGIARVVTVPADSAVQVLPDHSFFIRDVLIARPGSTIQRRGQITFYPERSKEMTRSHPYKVNRQPGTVAVTVYHSMRF